jgi:hypothetical protein
MTLGQLLPAAGVSERGRDNAWANGTLYYSDNLAKIGGGIDALRSAVRISDFAITDPSQLSHYSASAMLWISSAGRVAHRCSFVEKVCASTFPASFFSDMWLCLGKS